MLVYPILSTVFIQRGQLKKILALQGGQLVFEDLFHGVSPQINQHSSQLITAEIASKAIGESKGYNLMGSTLSKNKNNNNQHTPNLAIFPKLQHSPPLVWKVKHVRQDLLNKQLRQPQGYQPSPFSSSSFHKLGSIQAYYRGEWKKGIPHGKGQIVFKDESYFKGYMNEGSAKGPQCLFITKDGSYYLGSVSQGSKRSGKGIFVQRSGEEQDKGYKYEGQWLQNLPHGEGSQYFANGDSFSGRFVKGLRQGEGTYTWQKGAYSNYKGFFKNNVFEGKGILQSRDHAIIQGNFECEDYFNIKNSTIFGQDFKLTNCQLNEGLIQSFKYQEKQYMSLGKEGPIVNNSTSSIKQSEKIRQIMAAVEKSYQTATKHSQAMDQLKKSLPNLKCQWYNPIKSREPLCSMEICGRKIQVFQ